jgi:hypothetical protein
MDGGFGADNRCEKLHQCSTINGAQSLEVARDALIFAGLVTLGVVVCILVCVEAAAALGIICTVDEPGCEQGADTLVKDLLDLGSKDATDAASKDATDALAKGGSDALAKGGGDDLLNGASNGGFSATRQGVGTFTNLGKEIGVKHLDAIAKAGGFQNYLELIKDTVETGVDTSSIEATNPAYLTLRSTASRFFVVADPQTGSIVTAFYNTPSGPLGSLWNMLLTAVPQ